MKEDYGNISITIYELTKQYAKDKGIHDINVTFQAGTLNLVVGHNGSGKSTLFKCIMGLCNYHGSVIKRRVRIGYAPEDYNMPTNMTVMDFLISIGRVKGGNTHELKDIARYYLDMFDLDALRNQYIRTLSHGMRQKVNLLQAFVYEPKILLLDEPLIALDQDIIPKVVQLIQKIAKHSLVLVSTHHPGRFGSRNKKIYRMAAGTMIDE